MEKPERDGIDVLFIIAKVAALHVSLGLMVSLLAIYPLAVVILPKSLPLGFAHGIAAGIPSAYVLLRVSSGAKTFTAGRSLAAGLFFLLFSEIIGFWAWLALSAMGVGVFAASFVLGLAVASALPFFTIALRALSKRALLRNPDSRN